MDPIVLTVIEHALRAIMAFGPGILAAIMGTEDDEAAVELARTRAEKAIAKIRTTPVDDAVRDAIAAHGLAAPALPVVAPHDRRVVERMLVGGTLSHEERRTLRALAGLGAPHPAIDAALEHAARSERGDEPTRETKVPT